MSWTWRPDVIPSGSRKTELKTLEKRTFDSRLFDFNCTDLLDAGETVTSITSIAADQGGLVFSGAVFNIAPITYPDGRVAQAGKVIQVTISAGTIPAPALFITCTVRAQFITNLGSVLEATVLLRLIDNPPF